MKEYWIIWGYSSYNGHTPGSSRFTSFEAMKKVLDNKDNWPKDCYPSATFETVNGEVI